LQAVEHHFGAGVSLLRQLTGLGDEGPELLLNFLRCLERRFLFSKPIVRANVGR